MRDAGSKRRRGATWPIGAALALLVLAAAGLPGCSSLPRTAAVPPTESGILAASYRKLGREDHRQGRFERAEVFFMRMLSVTAAVDDRPGVVEALVSLGRVRLALGDTQGAEAWLLEALAAVAGIVRPDLEAQARGGLGAVALRRGQPAVALDWYESALALPLADPGRERAVLLHDRGVARRHLGALQEAAASLRLALAMHEELGDRAGIAAACHELAEVHAAGADVDAALPLARRALLLDRAQDLPLQVAQDLTLLGRLAEAAGDAEQAADYFRRAEMSWRALGRDAVAQKVAVRLREAVNRSRGLPAP